MHSLSAPPDNSTSPHLCGSKTLAAVRALVLGVYKYPLAFALLSLLHFPLPLLVFFKKDKKPLYGCPLFLQITMAPVYD